MAPINSESLDPIGIADGFREALPYEPTQDDAELCQRIKLRFARAHEHKLSTERDMDFWRRYVKGEQAHWYRDRDTGEIVQLAPRDSKRLSSMNNVLRPALRSLVGKLTRAIPTFQFVPPTMDATEVSAARVADAFFEYFRRKEELDVKYTEIYEDVGAMGSGVVQLEWDPTSGMRKAFCGECESSFDEDMIKSDCPTCTADLQEAAAMDIEGDLMLAQAEGRPPAEPEQVSEAMTKKIPKLEEIFDGDVCVHVRDPRDIFVEPGVTDPKKLRWEIYRSIEPVTEVRRRFPEMGVFVGPNRAEQYSPTARVSDAMDLDEHCTLLEYHEGPTELYPKGRIVWIANDIILKEIESPYYNLRRLPFFFFRWTLNRGEFWGESFIAQAWHRQKELNQIETIFREYAEIIARTKVLIPMSAKVAPDTDFAPITGQKIKYNAGGGSKPEYMVPPEMPQSMFNRRAEIAEDIRIQAGITSQEAGLDVQDPNGRAMAIVEAEADQQVGPIMRRNVSEWSALHRGLLILVKERYSPERKFTVAGEDNYAETFSFSELNLSPGWDIQLEVEDGLSKNQALRLTQAGELLQWGVFTDPQTGMPDIRKFIRVAKIKVPGIGPDLVSPDYAAAMDLVRQLKRGEMAEPRSFDDATIFAEVLYGWLKSHGRREDPEIVQQVEGAWQFYTQWAVSGIPPAGLPLSGQGGAAGGGPSDMSAPGGTPNNPGMLGTDLAGGGSVATEANATVQQADATAEQGARVQSSREG